MFLSIHVSNYRNSDSIGCQALYAGMCSYVVHTCTCIMITTLMIWGFYMVVFVGRLAYNRISMNIFINFNQLLRWNQIQDRYNGKNYYKLIRPPRCLHHGQLPLDVMLVKTSKLIFISLLHSCCPSEDFCCPSEDLCCFLCYYLLHFVPICEVQTQFCCIVQGQILDCVEKKGCLVSVCISLSELYLGK